VGAADASNVIARGHEGGGDRSHAGDGAQALDAFIVGGDVLDDVLRVDELVVDVAHDREQRGDLGE
jgi:hypothetical protein